MLTDTVGFFDYCVPLTNEKDHTVVDSLQKYYIHGVYNYITPKPAPKKLSQTTSLFSNNNLKPIHSGPLAINQQSTDWITLVFLSCLFIFAWIQTLYAKRLGQIFRAVAQPHFVNQLEREGNLFKERINLGLNFIYYSISSIFIHQVFREYNSMPAGFTNLTLTGIIFAGLIIFEMLKYVIVFVTGIIFNTSETARQYQLNTMIFNNITGVTLFPVSIIAFYWNNPLIIIIGIAIVSLLILYRIFRCILIGLTNINYNLLYLFLYLCTLEILPIILLYSALSSV
jgi:hypothetical protein